MNTLRRVRTAIALVALVVVAASIILVWFTVSSQVSRDRTLRLVAEEGERMSLLQESRAAALTEASAVSGYFALRDESLLTSFSNAKALLDRSLVELALMGPHPGPYSAGELLSRHNAVSDAYQALLDGLGSGDNAGALMAVPPDFEVQARDFVAGLAAAAQAAAARIREANRLNDGTQDRSDRIVLAVAGVWALVILGAGFALHQFAVAPSQREREALLRRAIEAERERGRVDSLTNTLEHGAFVEDLQLLAAAGQSFALAMGDVDDLKMINDTYGHQTGDAALIVVAKAMRGDGAIVGRYGGDEFVAALPGANRETAEEYKRAVLEAVARAGLIEPESGEGVPVVFSIGLAVFPDEAETIDDLIRLADEAMYTWRREQREEGGGRAPSRGAGDIRETMLLGEILPLLTSTETVERKFQLAARRLSIGAGYDGVSIYLHRTPDSPAFSNTFAKVPFDVMRAWDRAQVEASDATIMSALGESKRPLFVADAFSDTRLSLRQRELLRETGMKSVLIVPMIWQDRLVGAMSVGRTRKNAFTTRDARLLSGVSAQVTAIVETDLLLSRLQQTTAKLLEAHTESVMMVAHAAESHDPSTANHLRRVCQVTTALAIELGKLEEDATQLGIAAMLHDIGKLRVPPSILGSTAALTPEEWTVMRNHTLWGAELLVSRPGFELAAIIARWHHERADGKGYPDGLAGDEIPESVAIAQVADAFDALISDRPYRSGRSAAEAVREIKLNAGSQFSPRVVAALERLLERGELPDDSASRGMATAA